MQYCNGINNILKTWICWVQGMQIPLLTLEMLITCYFALCLTRNDWEPPFLLVLYEIQNVTKNSYVQSECNINLQGLTMAIPQRQCRNLSNSDPLL